MIEAPELLLVSPRGWRMAIDTEPGSTLRESPGRMTADEFYAWLDEDTRAEWVAGVVTVFMSTSNRHNQLIKFLVIVIQAWIDAHNLGELWAETFLMRLFTPT